MESAMSLLRSFIGPLLARCLPHLSKSDLSLLRSCSGMLLARCLPHLTSLCSGISLLVRFLFIDTVLLFQILVGVYTHL